MSAWGALEWSRPEWLYGLAVVPLVALVIVWLDRRRARRLDAFSEATVRRRTQPLPSTRRRLRAAVSLVGLAGLIVAAAGPRWGTERVTEPPVGQRIVFALDVSRSMLARDAGSVEASSRLDRAKAAIRQVLGGMPAAEAGLVVFAGEASLVVPLTRDLSAIGLYLASVGPDWISDPSTDLANAVAVAVDAFGTTPGAGRAIVLLSDGEDQAGGVEGAVAAARERSIEVATVGVGSADGARIPLGDGWMTAAGEEVVTRLEREPLEDLAAATGGVYAELGRSDAIPSLSSRLRSLDAASDGGSERERKADRYRWPLALAVLCLGLEVALRLGARRPRAGGLPLEATALVAAIAVLGMARAQEPRQMYDEGRYEEALELWRARDRSADATPSDAYHRGSAAYRLARWRESAAGYAVAARTEEVEERAAEAWYNAGNARYRIAEEVQRAREDEAERFWDIAIQAYTASLLRDPDDADAKHNLELALRRREQSGGGGGGGGGGGDGGGQGAGGGGGGSTGRQPPSTGSGAAPRGMTRSEAERLLDALAAREREALERGEEERRAGQRRRPGW